MSAGFGGGGLERGREAGRGGRLVVYQHTVLPGGGDTAWGWHRSNSRQTQLAPRSAGNGSHCVVVGDFNGDGRLDLVTGDFKSTPSPSSCRWCRRRWRLPSGHRRPDWLFTVDGTSYTTAQTFNWTSFTTHTVSFTSPQAGGAGKQYAFSAWADGSTSNPRTITVAASATTYTADFVTQYQITTAVSPAGCGTVTAPPSGTYLTAGTATWLAVATAGCIFNAWSVSPTANGTLTNATSDTTATVALTGPATVTANFSPAASGQQYNAVTDFNIAANPNGQWSYLVNGSPLTVAESACQGLVGIECWSNGGTQPNFSFISDNITSSPIQEGRTVVLPPGELNMDPENNSITVRWTAPNAGNWSISGFFSGLDTVSQPHPAKVILNFSTTLLSTAINFSGEVSNFSFTLALKAGDVLDFEVDAGYFNDTNLGTGFNAIISNIPGPDLTISKTHTGNFTQGQIGTVYTIGVSNVGTRASSGTVTAADTLPAGLTATAMSGNGWDCSGNSFPVVGNGSATVSCTRSDALGAGSAYPAITLTVNVAANAPSMVTNTATVAGGGDVNTANNSATDPTIVALQVVGGSLNLATGLDCSNNLIATGETNDCHWTVAPPAGATAPAQTVYPGNGDWPTPWLADGPNSTWIAVNASSQGQPAAPYSFNLTFDLSGYDLATVSLSGRWTIDDQGTLSLNGNQIASLPPGNPWASLHSFAVAAGSPFLNPGLNTLTLTITNSDKEGDGARLEGTLTGVLVAPYLTISKTHTGNFTPGQSGATYTIGVSNVGELPSSGTVTAADTLPTGLTATAMSGSGWDCSNNSFPVVGNGSATVNCTRSDALDAGATYPAITLTVNVAGNAPASVTNTAEVEWSGSSNTANDPTTIEQPPTADSVSPTPASGADQTFTLNYSTHNGKSLTDLFRVYGEFNTSDNHVNGCEVEYYAPDNTLYLKNDGGTAWQGPLTAGTSGTLQNSQCMVNGSETTAAGSGQTLTLTLSVSATPTFVGTQNIYMVAIDSEGSSSGWQNRGTWTPAADTSPTADSVTPTPASGPTQTFTAKYSTHNGKPSADLSRVYVEFNTSNNHVNGCEVEYYAPLNHLYLKNDAGTAWQGPLVAGAGTLANSQCTVNGAGSLASGFEPDADLEVVGQRHRYLRRRPEHLHVGS